MGSWTTRDRGVLVVVVCAHLCAAANGPGTYAHYTWPANRCVRWLGVCLVLLPGVPLTSTSIDLLGHGPYLYVCTAALTAASALPWPCSPTTALGMVMNHTWAVLPNASEVHGNAVRQRRGSDAGASCGSCGAGADRLLVSAHGGATELLPVLPPPPADHPAPTDAVAPPLRAPNARFDRQPPHCGSAPPVSHTVAGLLIRPILVRRGARRLYGNTGMAHVRRRNDVPRPLFVLGR